MARVELLGEVWASLLVGSSGDLDRPTPTQMADGQPADVYPARRHYNWLLNAIHSNVEYLERKGIFDWSESIPYDQYGLARDGGQIYYSLSDNNTGNQPSLTIGTSWGKAGDIFQPETPVYLVVADESVLGTGSADGQLRGTESGNLYTWHEITSKWRVRSGNSYLSVPAFANVEYDNGTIISVNGINYRFNAGEWSQVSPTIVGALIRPTFAGFSASTQINLSGAAGYHISGIGWVYFQGILSYNFTSLSAGVPTYLYINQSSLSSPGPITASNLVDSTTAPTFNATHGGWYNGSDRCIFGVMGLSGTSYMMFHHSEDTVMYDEQITDASSVAYTSVWTALILSVPAFTSRSIITVYMVYSTADSSIRWKKTGSMMLGHAIGRATSNARESINQVLVYPDTSRNIDISASASGALTTILTNGFLMPKGM